MPAAATTSDGAAPHGVMQSAAQHKVVKFKMARKRETRKGLQCMLRLRDFGVRACVEREA